MKKDPLVSIVMNCYNGENFLVDSIKSIISQTYQNWELIFWDNRSTDNSASIVKKFKDKRIKYFYAEKHTLLYEARSLAINKSVGEFIAFLDVDDWWIKEKLEVQVPYFDNHKIGLIHSNFYRVDQIISKTFINYKNDLPSGKVTNHLLKDYRVGWLTVIIRKKAYNSLIDKFNGNYNIIGDFDLNIRLSIEWEFLYLKDVLAYCRWHGKNLQIIESNLHLKELQCWLAENEKNLYLSKLNGFKFFKNNLNRMHSISMAKNGLNKDAYKSLKHFKGFFYKIIIITIIIMPNKFINYLLKKFFN